MGYLPKATPEMGEYSVEIRNESFYLYGEDASGHDFDGEDAPRHAILVYESSGPTHRSPTGTPEFLIADIPKIRAALDQVEHVQGAIAESLT